MTLFKRLPRLRWKASEDQEIIPPDVQTQCPELGTDFKTLAEELMPHFRELDASALQRTPLAPIHPTSRMLGLSAPLLARALKGPISGFWRVSHAPCSGLTRTGGDSNVVPINVRPAGG
jgi:hypothetical protein